MPSCREEPIGKNTLTSRIGVTEYFRQLGRCRSTLAIALEVVPIRAIKGVCTQEIVQRVEHQEADRIGQIGTPRLPVI